DWLLALKQAARAVLCTPNEFLSCPSNTPADCHAIKTQWETWVKSQIHRDQVNLGSVELLALKELLRNSKLMRRLEMCGRFTLDPYRPHGQTPTSRLLYNYDSCVLDIRAADEIIETWYLFHHRTVHSEKTNAKRHRSNVM